MATVIGSGPGKTAPKLCADFLQFDPQKNGIGNVLSEHPPPIGEGYQPQPHRDACRHDYATKLSQSVTPPLDFRPDGSSQYKLAVVCKKCRIHADIRIDHQQATNPCPNSECPLHHFQRADDLDETGTRHIKYGWQCSSATCRALLTITFKLARISKQDQLLLTDTSKLKQRYEDIVQSDATREGVKQANPVEALNRLRRYLRDSLNIGREKRKFPANNKRFMEAFGVDGRDCREMLERLGFEYTDEEQSWTLPNPPEVQDRLHSDGDNLREVIEDVDYELRALMARTAAEFNIVNLAAEETWSSAERDLQRTLAAQGYQRYVPQRRPSAPEHDATFAALGALPDFSDKLIEFAYNRQTTCNPATEPYYFECLQQISKKRGTEDLLLKVTMVESEGVVSRKDLAEAYRYFAQDPGFPNSPDDRVLNMFHVQQSDQGVAGQQKGCEMLTRIGKARKSQRILNAAQQQLETAEDAYAWLGQDIGPHSDDAFVTTAYAIKIADNKDLEETGKKAVSLIAKARRSDHLNRWLLGDDLNEMAMGVEEALKLLGVDEGNVNSIEPSLWPAIFANARESKSGQQTENAIAAIQQALQGGTGMSNGNATADHPPETWPVGLTSHGNTCYLNSLLQYYFAIKPIRDIVLEYHKHRLDLSSGQVEKLERVGQRRVLTTEISGGQKFADELKHLFERMIKDPEKSVKPEQDLVCRAFLDPIYFHELERKIKGANSAVDGKPSQAPAHNDKADAAEGGKEQIPSSPSSATMSSTTLQDTTDRETDDDVKMKESDMPPTPPASPGQKPIDQQSEKAPPLPPRRFSTTTSDTLKQAEDRAREQQDVTEVHDNITQRLRAGMLPLGADNRGEQNDNLRNLYAIGLSQTPVVNGVQQKSEQIYDSSIQLNVPSDDTDLYTELDGYFDLSQISEGSDNHQYKSIVSLPPLVQVNMPRIGFNSETKQVFKSEKRMRLFDELYLDRYCDGSDAEILPRRREAWGWRKRVQELKKEQRALSQTAIDIDGPGAVAESANFIESLDSVNKELAELGEDTIETDSELQQALTADANFQVERLKSLNEEVTDLTNKIDSAFADFKKLKYRLAAVFFHRGATSHGHYWVCIHDFKTNMWRRYNDETVTEVSATDVSEILESVKNPRDTPTYAVYVQDSLKEQYVDPVCRAPEEKKRDATAMVDGEAWAKDWQQDSSMPDAPPLPAPAGTVNPQHTFVTDTNPDAQGDWDAKRPVPDVKWSPRTRRDSFARLSKVHVDVLMGLAQDEEEEAIVRALFGSGV